MNWHQQMEQTLENLKNNPTPPTLLLHACCAPCSSSVLERLSKVFLITILYYNPNIYPKAEHDRRQEELVSFLARIKQKHPISCIQTEYAPKEFHKAVSGLEETPEGGERCFRCYALRLEYAAVYAKAHGFDYFTTTLSVSPYKNAEKLNRIGRDLSERYDVSYLYADFKKKNGYQRSVELSKEYGLYRQSYCGCVFSYEESIKREENLKYRVEISEKV
jgi:predicted adenine nucleotide alpha hydrolase (AANH) superfamily ATPase